MARRRAKSRPSPTLELVRRRCRVCEWEGILAEPLGAEPACPLCHAPTDRTVILEQIPGLGKGTKNPYAAALGKLGARKGGLARAKRLTAARRSEIARKAARARWRKRSRKR